MLFKTAKPMSRAKEWRSDMRFYRRIEFVGDSKQVRQYAIKFSKKYSQHEIEAIRATWNKQQSRSVLWRDWLVTAGLFGMVYHYSSGHALQGQISLGCTITAYLTNLVASVIKVAKMNIPYDTFSAIMQKTWEMRLKKSAT